jgi:hypothetical protein
MDDFRIESCRSCQAGIIWAATAGGKTMPVDAAPSDDGNVALTLRPGGSATAAVLSAATIAAETSGLFPSGLPPLRTSHFVTCPNAARAILKAQPKKTMTIPTPVLNLPPTPEPPAEPDVE